MDSLPFCAFIASLPHLRFLFLLQILTLQKEDGTLKKRDPHSSHPQTRLLCARGYTQQRVLSSPPHWPTGELCSYMQFSSRSMGPLQNSLLARSRRERQKIRGGKGNPQASLRMDREEPSHHDLSPQWVRMWQGVHNPVFLI